MKLIPELTSGNTAFVKKRCLNLVKSPGLDFGTGRILIPSGLESTELIAKTSKNRLDIAFRGLLSDSGSMSMEVDDKADELIEAGKVRA